jgi:aspartyl/asparaginyl-tRNA synthetase
MAGNKSRKLAKNLLISCEQKELVCLVAMANRALIEAEGTMTKNAQTQRQYELAHGKDETESQFLLLATGREKYKPLYDIETLHVTTKDAYAVIEVKHYKFKGEHSNVGQKAG